MELREVPATTQGFIHPFRVRQLPSIQASVPPHRSFPPPPTHPSHSTPHILPQPAAPTASAFHYPTFQLPSAILHQLLGQHEQGAKLGFCLFNLQPGEYLPPKKSMNEMRVAQPLLPQTWKGVCSSQGTGYKHVLFTCVSLQTWHLPGVPSPRLLLA